MKNYHKALMVLGVGALVGATTIAALAFIVAVFESFGLGYGMPFIYFESLKLPILSIALPVVGILALLMILPAILRVNNALEAVDALRMEEIVDERRLKTA